MTHVLSSTLAPSDPAICRSATLAIDVSSTVMNVAIDRMKVMSHGLWVPAAERLASQPGSAVRSVISP